MKKMICLILAVLLFPVWSIAEVDLKSMTIDELVFLKLAIAEELLSRDELKEVSVPAGEYTVGDDIPAGNYSVTSASSACILTVNEYETMHYLGKGDQIGKLVLEDGDVVSIVGGCIFTIYQGLSF